MASVNSKGQTLQTAWKMLIWLLVAQVMVSFVGRSLAPLTILIGKDLSLSHTQIGLLPAALFLGQSLAAIPSGLLADRLGSKKQLFGTVFLLGISFILITLTTHFYLLLFAVVVGGGAYAAMHPTTNRGILYWFPQHSRGTAMGIKQMGITAGSALAALLLLPAAKEIGWRPALFISCLVLLAVGALVAYYYQDSAQSITKKSTLSNKSEFWKDLRMVLNNRQVLLLSISAMGLQGAQLCLTTYIILFAFEKLEMTLVLAGLLLVLAEVGGSIGRVAWGAISDRFFAGNRMIIMFFVTILTGICAIIFAMLLPATPLLAVLITVFIFGFSVSGYNGVWMTIIVELVQKEKSGLATGVTVTISSWGVLIIPPLFGYIVDTSGTFTYGWLYVAVLMMVVVLVLKQTTSQQQMKGGDKHVD
ncbi:MULTISPECIES: MFS transporter [Sporosarcina]|uniref:MFS transporter n=1 Tax=Sporosarcina TaxID=1569 RepID=UPI001E338DFA|nr:MULTISPECIES: MFS transporter [Sporosarcina]GKV65277.1 permease [Sporosarcina sp. NCCP-2331]GLB55401.1 permease [Sporosarcina sp. NCCP-2378]